MLVQVFLTSMRLFLETRPEDVGAAAFDKDDDLAVEFVTAASNLRSLCYNIPTQSLFAAKVHSSAPAIIHKCCIDYRGEARIQKYQIQCHAVDCAVITAR